MPRRILGPGPQALNYNDGLHWLYGLYHLLAVLALVIGAIVVVMLLVRHRGTTPPAKLGPLPPPASPAVAELELRYARGEVDRTEYLQRRADLSGRPGPEDQPPAPPLA